jgi:DNA mismatch repair protein MutS2
LRTLELPQILQLLQEEAVCAAAKEEALKLRPSDILTEVRERLLETSDAKKLISLKGTPPLSDIRDVTGSLSRARLGGMLNTRELLDIAGVLRAARQMKSWTSEEAGSLTGLFGALIANKFLEEKITLSIVGEEEIADAASSELASIRRHMRAANARIRDVLNKIITSPSYAKVLQEPIITMRSDRYVIPVKAEHKGALGGLVHDVSSSGQTVFIEPMQVVQANNEIRELQAKEKKEIERILMELSSDAASFEEDILCNQHVLVRLDVVFAKAKLSYRMKADAPGLSEDGVIRLKRARHPLIDPKKAVPIDISVGGQFDTLVITGPNTGGKTVSLKTLGVCCLMAACGLHIPADSGSAVPVLKKVLADVGDEQSIEQSLSTFSSHMKNIVEMTKRAGRNSLVLIDEIGAGTDPAEGAALAKAVLEYLLRKGAKIVATTHYGELKEYAYRAEGIENASVEFDPISLRPTYKLQIGIPGASNAFAIAKRLCLDAGIIA